MKRGKKENFADIRPPNSPWIPIEKRNENLATISYYYGDPRSQVIPIRDVTSKRNAKRDPNIETKTYGLFSTCCKNERKAIVEKGIATQFFCTSRVNATRVLTGYYRPAWFCKFGPDDYVIAADKVRFVSPGFALNKLITFMDGFPIDRFFRTWKYLRDEKVIRQLLLLLNTARDSTADYLSEMKCQEEYALEKYGYIYNRRSEGLSWKFAAELMRERIAVIVKGSFSRKRLTEGGVVIWQSKSGQIYRK
jgi:hypothetical protein